MTRDAFKLLIKGLVEGMDALLTPHKFQREPYHVTFSKRRFERWRRYCNWKICTVDISYQEPKAISESNIKINLSVDMLFEGNLEGLFDGTSVADVVGNKRPDYLPPKICASLRSSGFVAQLIRDTEAALTWFELFGTAERCLTRLLSGETNIGPIRDHGAARHAHDHLVAVLQRKRDGS